MKNLVRNIFRGRKQPCNILDVIHSASKNEDLGYIKDKAWRDPCCRIVETATGKVIKDFGVTVHRT